MDATTGVGGAARAESLTEKYGDHEAAVRTAPEQARQQTCKGVVDTIKDKVHDATADAAVHAKDSVQHAASSAVGMAGNFGRDVTGFIRRHPGAALLVGFGAGCILGLVARRLTAPRT
jgi:hypothetical protein